MEKKTKIIIGCIVAAIVAAGLGVLIWWLVAGSGDGYSIIELEGEGFQGVEQTAAFTRIQGAGDMFWWFYPATFTATTRPIILWLDGVTGLPPSLLANFGMFGPLDFNLNRRTNSWIDDFNLLFVDAPLGTGFSTANENSSIPDNAEENADHLLFTLKSFYTVRKDFVNAPLYIFGQGDGAAMALSLAILIRKELNAWNVTTDISAGAEPVSRRRRPITRPRRNRRRNTDNDFKSNLKGVVLGNGVVSPALVLTKLGFYLEEMGYIDGRGRAAVESFSNEANSLVNGERFEEAFDKFATLGDVVNEAGAVAVNLGHIVEKLQQGSTSDTDLKKFMEETVAPALGISSPDFDSQRKAAIESFRGSYMVPVTEKVEQILQSTNLTVIIYNGNLDAVSNTPGQLEWINSLEWSGQTEFLTSTRRPLVVNGLLEGHFKETNRLKFYWMNAAGQSVPLDSPVAMKRVLELSIF